MFRTWYLNSCSCPHLSSYVLTGSCAWLVFSPVRRPFLFEDLHGGPATSVLPRFSRATPTLHPAPVTAIAERPCVQAIIPTRARLYWYDAWSDIALAAPTVASEESGLVSPVAPALLGRQQWNGTSRRMMAGTLTKPAKTRPWKRLRPELATVGSQWKAIKGSGAHLCF